MASANTAKEKAQEATDNARSAASEAGDAAREKASEAADYVRDQADNASDYASRQVNAVGEYLKDADLKEMSEDLTGLIRKYPLMSIAVGVGIGMLVAGITRR